METAAPDILTDLLRPTPSGATKLIAAWDGLHAETRMQILCRFCSDDPPAHFDDRLLDKALADANSYVRYLAVRAASSRLAPTRDEPAAVRRRRDRIEADIDPLVRYALLEGRRPDPAEFLSLPQPARLALVRGLDGHADYVASILQHALDNRLLDTNERLEAELHDVILDYLNRPRLQTEYRPEPVAAGWYGSLEFDYNHQLCTLWKLLPELPLNIAAAIATHCPPPLTEEIPIEQDALLNVKALAALLFRRDVRLSDLRQHIFTHRADFNDFIVAAAISHNFSPSFSDFHSLLTLPEDERTDVVVDLLDCSDLPLCIRDAIHDRLRLPGALSWRHDHVVIPYEFGDDRDQFVRDRIKELKDNRYHLERELLLLRVYRLARNYVSMDPERTDIDPPDGELGFLREHVVKGDTWATFMNFAAAWDHQYNSKKLERYLPRVEEVGADDVGNQSDARQENAKDDGTESLRLDRMEQSINAVTDLVIYVVGESLALATFIWFTAFEHSGYLWGAIGAGVMAGVGVYGCQKAVERSRKVASKAAAVSL